MMTASIEMKTSESEASLRGIMVKVVGHYQASPTGQRNYLAGFLALSGQNIMYC